MDFFIFADGYLQENETNFTYSILNTFFHSFDFQEPLKNSNDSYGLPLKEIRVETDETVFIYDKKEEYTVLDDLKKHIKAKQWKIKRDWLAYTIVDAISNESQKGFFVLPIPQNFLVGQSSVKFIYKAIGDMPITGFDPTQSLTHVKRLVLYLYGEETFEELLEQKEAKTSDSFLIAIANASEYKELLRLIPYVPKAVEEPNTKKKRKEKEFKNKTIQSHIEPLEQSAVDSMNLAPQKSVAVSPVPKINRGNGVSLNKWVLLSVGVFLFLSVLLSGVLIVDKWTYPSQVELLKKENAQLIEKETKNEEHLSDLEKEVEKSEKENKSLKKNNAELQEEIEANVKTIKELVDKNDELKKSIK